VGGSALDFRFYRFGVKKSTQCVPLYGAAKWLKQKKNGLQELQNTIQLSTCLAIGILFGFGLDIAIAGNGLFLFISLCTLANRN
jgi:hypothetical protein